jgi:hypothetical protein
MTGDESHTTVRPKMMMEWYYPLFAYSFNPVKSIPTTGSFPTTHALCPVGITAASPGPMNRYILKKARRRTIILDFKATFTGQ